MSEQQQKRCGAKTRNGGTCQSWGMKNGRCRLHGGKSTGPPKGSQNGLKHGAYAKLLTPEEKKLWDSDGLEPGSVDAEIKMAKIQYARCIEHKAHDIAQKLLGRIAQLEATRANILRPDEDKAVPQTIKIIVKNGRVTDGG